MYIYVRTLRLARPGAGTLGFIYIYIYTHTHIYIYIYIWLYVYIYIYMFVPFASHDLVPAP